MCCIKDADDATKVFLEYMFSDEAQARPRSVARVGR